MANKRCELVNDPEAMRAERSAIGNGAVRVDVSGGALKERECLRSRILIHLVQ
jgi:hypothetical protein